MEKVGGRSGEGIEEKVEMTVKRRRGGEGTVRGRGWGGGGLENVKNARG
jgi:hypothetical protein